MELTSRNPDSGTKIQIEFNLNTLLTVWGRPEPIGIVFKNIFLQPEKRLHSNIQHPATENLSMDRHLISLRFYTQWKCSFTFTRCCNLPISSFFYRKQEQSLLSLFLLFRPVVDLAFEPLIIQTCTISWSITWIFLLLIRQVFCFWPRFWCDNVPIHQNNKTK